MAAGVSTELYPLIISFLPKCELAQGRMALACQKWLLLDREYAWTYMVLSSGNSAALAEAGWQLILNDIDFAEAHATMQTFLSAPRHVQERAARSAQSLHLKICQLEEFIDHYEKWITLPFDGLKRLVIDGPDYWHKRQLLLRDSLDGLRLGLFLSKVAQTVDTLIILACITEAGSEEDKNDDILACTVSSLPRLVVLDLSCGGNGEWLYRGLFPPPKFVQWNLLQSCQGIAVDFENLNTSWLSRVPNLKRLYLEVCCGNLSVHNRKGDGLHSLDFATFVCFLADKCPLLEFLKLILSDGLMIKRQTFARIPARLKWLVLYVDSDIRIEGFTMPNSPWWNGKLQAERDEKIFKHLRPWLPQSCTLCVTQTFYIRVEETESFIMNPQGIYGSSYKT